jgi:hypothetical protein
MSGARFTYDSPDPDVYEFFKSEFDSTTGEDGDQAWELVLQPIDNFIVAGGFHYQPVMMSNRPTFAAIRLCENPGDENCESAEAPLPDGGGVWYPNWGDLPQDAGRTDSSSGSPLTVTASSPPLTIVMSGDPSRTAIDEQSGTKTIPPTRAAQRSLLIVKSNSSDVFAPVQLGDWDALA